MTTYTQPRENLWPILPFGAEEGYNTEGDVLVNVSADGVDLNAIWAEVQAALAAWNAERGAIVNLLSYATTNTADAIPQSTSDDSFESCNRIRRAGWGTGTCLLILLLGYTFEDYDKATRFTWKFLRDATAEQIKTVANLALASDAKLVQGTILERLFDNTPDVNEWNHTVYPIYNGDSFVPRNLVGSNVHSAASALFGEWCRNNRQR